MDPNEKEKYLKQMAVFSTIPFVLAIPPVLGWFFGDWLDKKLGTHPHLMYGLVFIGFAAGFREVYRIIQRFGDGT